MACKGAKVSDYGGKSLNISRGGTIIEMDPADQKQTEVLKRWFSKDYESGEKKVTAITQSGGESSIRGDLLPLSTFSEMQATLYADGDFMSGDKQEAQYFKVVCDLLMIQTRRMLWYPAC
jgi:hypothetical protein